MSNNHDPQVIFGKVAFTTLLVVIVVIAGLLISQRLIPHAQRPTLRTVQTVVTTVTPTTP